MSDYTGGDPGADPADEWKVPEPHEPYDAGGWLPAGWMTVELHPDECVIVRRDGTWKCVRAHEHGDQLVVDILNMSESS